MPFFDFFDFFVSFRGFRRPGLDPGWILGSWAILAGSWESGVPGSWEVGFWDPGRILGSGDLGCRDPGGTPGSWAILGILGIRGLVGSGVLGGWFSGPGLNMAQILGIWAILGDPGTPPVSRGVCDTFRRPGLDICSYPGVSASWARSWRDPGDLGVPGGEKGAKMGPNC